jgi:hypothetical protein
MMANEGNADDDDVARRLREIREQLEADRSLRKQEWPRARDLDIAWLLGEVERQREEIARLRADRNGALRIVDELLAVRGRISDELLSIRGRIRRRLTETSERGVPRDEPK